MPTQLEAGKVTRGVVFDIAEQVARFHEKASTGPGIDEHGSLETIRFNWQENFQQTRNLRGDLIPEQHFDELESRVTSFISSNEALFGIRARTQRIRECHGDLHAGNIFILESSEPIIFDAIEFNKRFSCSDVAAEVAFLAMDLEHRGYPKLAEHFVSRYISASGDEQLMALLPFYKSYRAHVRGKVLGFRLQDDNLPEKEREAIAKDTLTYLQLALSYMVGDG